MKLVTTATSDGILLNALYSEGKRENTAVILIHGFLSDFYSHKFFHEIQDTLAQRGVGSIAIQNRGTGIESEFLTSDRLNGRIIGCYNELLEEAHLDITAWIEFLFSEGYTRIILAGHSLGTIKAVRYLFEGKHASSIEKLVLLAPFDKNGFIEKKVGNRRAEYLAVADEKMKAGHGLERVPAEYEDFLISYQTFHSWYNDSPLSNLFDFYNREYDFPILNKIAIPVQVIVGTKDEFFVIPEMSAFTDGIDVLRNNIKDLTLVQLPESLHTYVGFEEEVAKQVSQFV